MEKDKIFCYQCSQAVKGIGCISAGVCGKKILLS
jgi:hydroxylamine reductase (hybrid-cluster protein)